MDEYSPNQQFDVMIPHNKRVKELYDKYKQLVFFMCYKYLKEKELSRDVASEIFRDLLENPDKLQGIRDMKSWLYTVVRNKCLRVLSKLQRERNHLEKYVDYTQHTPSSDEGKFNISIRKEEQNRQQKLVIGLKKAINKLRDNHRTCIEQHYLQHKSYQEIMDSTKFTFKQVDNFLYYGKKRLKEILRRAGWDQQDLNDLFN